NAFRQRHRTETDEDARRLWAQIILCLTPVADTASILDLLEEDDMWTPEAAVRLLEIRGYQQAIPQLDTRAATGRPNGSGAPSRAMVRLATPEALAALARLRSTASEALRKDLDLWVNRHPLAPRW